jgi:hypothetical protein
MQSCYTQWYTIANPHINHSQRPTSPEKRCSIPSAAKCQTLEKKYYFVNLYHPVWINNGFWIILNRKYNSVAGIATRHGMNAPGFEPWYWGTRDFLSPCPFKPVLGPTQPPIEWVTGTFFGVKLPGRGVLYSSTSSAWSYIQCSHTATSLLRLHCHVTRVRTFFFFFCIHSGFILHYDSNDMLHDLTLQLRLNGLTIDHPPLNFLLHFLKNLRGLSFCLSAIQTD